MNADEVNEEMELLGERYDRIPYDDSDPDSRMLRAAFSDWQDFYWGEYDQWPVNDVAAWEQRLPELTVALARTEERRGSQEEPIIDEPSPTQPPIIIAEPTLVTGTWPLWMKVAAGSILALGLYKVARITKIL